VGVDVIREGDWALVWCGPNLSYIVRVGRGRFDTIRGWINMGEVIGKPWGTEVRTSLGERCVVTRPNPLEVLYRRGRHVTQVIYLRDAAYMALSAGVGPGSRVAEAGTGSGFLTAVLAWLVRPSGVVYTYDVKREYIEAAMENLRMAGLDRWVVAAVRDVASEGFDVDGLDAVFLDMPNPWDAVPHAYKALRSGGWLVIFSTTVEHMLKSIAALGRFIDVTVEEILLRNWKPKLGETRPDTWSMAFTGFIIRARKP